ncbi:MAG: LysR family transcriptional regulator [Proteobacteria bacterium]|nr:LysR family transcriptional regulator [Pseudomonadota bacterium]
MELYQLRTFVAVAEEGHLTRAAERLHTSQPAVSAHIKALEEELGLPLFKRMPKGMQLTKAGELLQEKARQTLQLENEIRIQAGQLRDEVAGIVTLGLNIDPKYLKISDLFSSVKSNFPGLELHLLQKTSWQVLHDIKTEQLDTGFVYGKIDAPEIKAFKLTRFNLLLAGPAAWEERMKSWDLKQLCNLPWIWAPEHCYFSDITESIFNEQKVEPQKAVISDQESAMKTLASSGVGVTLMIENEAVIGEQAGTIAIRDQPVAEIDLSFACHRKRVDDPLIQALVKQVEEVWSQE